MPAGNTFFNSKMRSSGSKANLFRLPFGVSMTTRSNCLSSESKGVRREGSARPFFLLIPVPISLLQRGCFVGEEGLFSSQNIETKTGGRLLGYAQEPRHGDSQDASRCDALLFANRSKIWLCATVPQCSGLRLAAATGSLGKVMFNKQAFNRHRIARFCEAHRRNSLHDEGATSVSNTNQGCSRPR